MSRSTISTFQLFALFPDEESARIYLEARIWPDGVMCPQCGVRERVSTLAVCATRKSGYYRCLSCAMDFTVRTGTVMERSKVPLHKWLYSMYLLVTARKGISSMQLAKEIGITQKSAWFVLGRLREACGGDGPDGGLQMLRGTVEVDETFVGGKEKNKHNTPRDGWIALWTRPWANGSPTRGSSHEDSRRTESDRGRSDELPPKTQEQSGEETGEKGREEGEGLA